MSHPEQMGYVYDLSQRYPKHFRKAKVLEVGSLNINGTVRIYFEDCDYTGIDLGPGPGVDLVCHVCSPQMVGQQFDTVISCEALEHDQYWQASLTRMQNLLRPAGLLIVTCAGPDREAHGTHESCPECSPHTLDYYRNLSQEDIEPHLHWPHTFDCTPQDTRFCLMRSYL